MKKEQSLSGFLLPFLAMILALNFFLIVLFLYPHDYDSPPDQAGNLKSESQQIQPLATTARTWKPQPLSPQSQAEKPEIVQSEVPALNSKPRDIQGMLNEAMGLVDDGSPQAAMELLENILKEDPRNEMALIEMGMIHLIDLKNPEKASVFLKRALEVNPDNRVVVTELVGIFDELNQMEEGTRYLQDLTSRYPENTTLAMGLGQMLAGQGRLNEALPWLEKAAEDGSSIMAVTDLADAYSRAGQGDKALQTYHRVIQTEQDKIANGFYSLDEGAGKKNLLSAYADHLSELLHQNKMSEAREALRKIEGDFPDDMNELAQRMGRGNGTPLR